MKMLQFAFYNDDNEYLPRLYPTDNCVVYPGSHDADCIRSWCSALPTDARRRFRKECPRDRSQSRTYDLIELALASRANLAVVPMQDYLELKNEEGRMNTPSVAYGNWTWRLSPRYRTRSLVERVKSLTEKTNRSTLKI